MKIATYKLTNLGAGNHILRAKATDGTLVSAFSNVISYSRVAVHTAVLNCSANAPTAVSIGKSLTASFLTHGGDYANYTFATGTILVKMDDGTGTLQDITSTAWSYGTGPDGREIGIVQIGNVTGTVYISVTAEAVANYIEDLAKIISEGSHTKQQIFSVNKTAFYWKKMPVGLS